MLKEKLAHQRNSSFDPKQTHLMIMWECAERRYWGFSAEDTISHNKDLGMFASSSTRLVQTDRAGEQLNLKVNMLKKKTTNK